MSDHELSDRQQRAVWELSAILMDHVTDGRQARRVAELLVFLDASETISVGWWRKAASLGDGDARDYLAQLINEGTAEPGPND